MEIIKEVPPEETSRRVREVRIEKGRSQAHFVELWNTNYLEAKKLSF